MKNTPIAFIVILLIGLLSMYLLYFKEDYCTFSKCRDLVPSISTTTETPAPTSKGTKRELNNGNQ
jgi:hypothetical protein